MDAIMVATGRREQNKRQRRERVLDAARTLFLSKGFSDTSINEIANCAHLAHGTIYLYFKNKEEIYATILGEGLELLGGAITRSVGEGSAPPSQSAGRI